MVVHAASACAKPRQPRFWIGPGWRCEGRVFAAQRLPAKRLELDVCGGRCRQLGTPLTPISSHDAKVVAGTCWKVIGTSPIIAAFRASPSPFHRLRLSGSARWMRGSRVSSFARRCKGPELVHGPASGRARLWLQGSSRGRDGSRAWRSSCRPACRRDHQSIRSRNPPRPDSYGS